jgi:hypothetical protein
MLNGSRLPAARLPKGSSSNFTNSSRLRNTGERRSESVTGGSLVRLESAKGLLRRAGVRSIRSATSWRVNPSVRRKEEPQRKYALTRP